jgi:hypothetical protein
MTWPPGQQQQLCPRPREAPRQVGMKTGALQPGQARAVAREVHGCSDPRPFRVGGGRGAAERNTGAADGEEDEEAADGEAG